MPIAVGYTVPEAFMQRLRSFSEAPRELCSLIVVGRADRHPEDQLVAEVVDQAWTALAYLVARDVCPFEDPEKHGDFVLR